ncbi:MAG: DUF4241 domain-containing protein [Alphaproteobacteria bacterium]|nr:DUF4241 domain-containing protein [Alphaproteobacteria bacterium]
MTSRAAGLYQSLDAHRVSLLGTILAHPGDPRLVVCDPELIRGAVPLSRRVRGQSTWSVSIAETRIDGHWRVAFALAEVEGAAPERWARAVFEDGAETFMVDYATVAITDADGARKIRDDAGLRAKISPWVRGPAGCWFFDAGSASCHLAWFSSGLGDGRYGAWWGLDATDEPVTLLVDLALPA